MKMIHVVGEKEGFTITTDFNKIDINKVYSLLSNSYWAEGRTKDIVVKSLKNSFCVSLFYHDNQIGLIRVITDYATFAYLCDVIIDDEFRNKGLGKWCLEFTLKHPDLINVNRWFLITRDAQEFYKKFDFISLIKPEKYMELII